MTAKNRRKQLKAIEVSEMKKYPPEELYNDEIGELSTLIYKEKTKGNNRYKK